MQNHNRKIYWRRPPGWLLLILGWPIIAVSLALAAGTPSPSQAAPSTIYVLTNGDDAYCDGTANTAYSGTAGTCAKQSVQAGVGAVATGGTVFIGSGVFTEQVVITRPMTLSGAGRSSTTVRSPQEPARIYTSTTDRVFKPIITVHDTNKVTIEKLTVDGAGRGNYDQGTEFVGVGYYNASGSVEYTYITGIRQTPLNSVQTGIGMDARNFTPNISQTLIFNDNVVTGYQKNGTVFNGEGLVVTATNNTITGSDVTSLISQNGIQISYGASGYIAKNTVSKNFYTGSSLGDASGVLVYKGGPNVEIAANNFIGNGAQILLDGVPNYNIHDNIISGIITTSHASFGIQIDQDQVNSTGKVTHNQITGHNFGIAGGDFSISPVVSNVVVSYNRIFSNTVAGIDTTGTPVGSSVPILITANNNRWGCDAGPNQPGCDKTIGKVIASNWLTVRLSAAQPVILTGGKSTVTANLSYNSTGQASGGFVPNGTPVIFTTTTGTISPAVVNTNNGIATATYLGGATPESAVIGVIVDNQLITTTITVACNTAAVSEVGDNNECGSFRYAVTHPPANKIITINAVSPIQLNDSLVIVGPLTIAGSNCALPAIIRPSNTFPPATNGLEVSGGVKLQNIKVEGFPGLEIKANNSRNFFKCVIATDTP